MANTWADYYQALCSWADKAVDLSELIDKDTGDTVLDLSRAPYNWEQDALYQSGACITPHGMAFHHHSDLIKRKEQTEARMVAELNAITGPPVLEQIGAIARKYHVKDQYALAWIMSGHRHRFERNIYLRPLTEMHRLAIKLTQQGVAITPAFVMQKLEDHFNISPAGIARQETRSGQKLYEALLVGMGQEDARMFVSQLGSSNDLNRIRLLPDDAAQVRALLLAPAGDDMWKHLENVAKKIKKTPYAMPRQDLLTYVIQNDDDAFTDFAPLQPLRELPALAERLIAEQPLIDCKQALGVAIERHFYDTHKWDVDGRMMAFVLSRIMPLDNWAELRLTLKSRTVRNALPKKGPAILPAARIDEPRGMKDAAEEFAATTKRSLSGKGRRFSKPPAKRL